MNNTITKALFKGLILLLVFTLLVGNGASLAVADEVVLVPADIIGTIRMGAEPIQSVNVYATWTNQSASISVNGYGATSVTYRLTVNVPQGTTPTYTVWAQGYFNGGVTNINFVPRTVAVTAGGTHTVDFGQANPARIAGSVQVGSEGIYYYNIEASGGGGRSSTYVYPGNATVATYSLPVDVLPGVPVTFSIPYYYNAAYLGDWNHYISFANKSVQVSPGATATLNFGTATPAIIEGDLTVVNGTLSYAYIYAYDAYNTYGAPYSYVRTTSSGHYRMAVMPGRYRVYGAASLTDGTNFPIPSQFTVPSTETYVDLAAGGSATVNWTLTVQYGSIGGTFTLTGPVSPNRTDIQSGSPNYRYANLYANGPYTLNNLRPGTHNMSAYSYYNNFQTSFTYPYSAFSISPSWTTSPRPVVVGDQTTAVDISSVQSFVRGKLTISGTKSLSEVSNPIDLRVYGVSPTKATGGSGSDRVEAQTGAYELILSEGTWQPSYIYEIFFQNPTENLDSRMRYLYDYATTPKQIPLTAGQTVTRDINYRTGSVTVTFRIEGGGNLSSPRLEGQLVRRDATGNVLWNHQIEAYSSQQNVAEGSVTMVGLEGTATVTARAYVVATGTLTTFGQLTLAIVPGAEQEVDIGGPTLTVEWPQPDYISENSNITVTGKVTDDVEVASVTVNGVAASLTSTNNPADPHEMAFSANITLASRGPNTLVTVATDTSDKTASDTRRVYWDEYPPHLSWTPADGTVTSSSVITVAGTATNDAGVASVTVNGVPVSLQSTNNPNDPLEVSFSTSVNLQDGDNYIQVVATDISNRTTSQTHKVTRTTNQPPVAYDMAITMDEDIEVERLLQAEDPDPGDTIEIELVSLSLTGVSIVPSSGTVPDGRVTLTPAPNFNGNGGSFTFRATDSKGAVSNTATATITINPVNDAPVADNKNVVTDEDTAVATVLSASDVDGDSLTYAIVGNPGHGTLSGTLPNVTYTPAANYNGPDSFTYKANDGTADSNVATVTITVNPVNDVPVISGLPTTLTLNEGGSTSLPLDSRVTDVETAAADMSWAGSSSASAVAVVNISASREATVNAIDGGGSAGIMLTATDRGDPDNSGNSPASASHTIALTVNNVAPAVGTITAPSEPVRVNTAINASAAFTDPGILDTHTAVWDWGDGTTSAGIVSETNGSGSVTGSHPYAAAGVYTVTLTVTDKDGGVGQSVFQFVVVYDPDAGFVTGGGWINSPPGAYAANQSLTGRANFGFVSKYQKGASTPTGQTEFQFKVGNLNFHSDIYEWLVIAGARAQYKGTGTINGQGNFGFMLVAIDGQINGGGGVDKFRIKIWDKDGGDAIVYDNKPGEASDSNAATELAGGSIVIHTK